MKPSDIQAVMAVVADIKSKPKPVGGAKPNGARKPRQREASDVEAASEVVGEAPPPPEAVEPDPQLSPEQAEQARKKYLLKRFWI
ncbi:ABC transporter ATP-binding protein/permease, partial [Mesorhizobium sp. M2D.F.Ca.ET.160.01.1.1]